MSRHTATYTLTKATDKTGKLFRIVEIGRGPASAIDHPELPVKRTENPGVWITDYSKRVQVWRGSLVVFVGDAEKRFSQTYCDMMGLERETSFRSNLLLLCHTTQVIATLDGFFTLEEVRDEGE